MNSFKNTVAILIDGAYFLNRFRKIYGSDLTASETAEKIHRLSLAHVGAGNYLYRIFYYDCLPFDKKIHNPITKKAIDFKKTQQYMFRNELFAELKKKRKIALRLGQLKDFKTWSFRTEMTKEIIEGKIKISELTENDIVYNLKQNGIDMKIGVDIASLAFKKIVDKIVLISGDSDFVPASKLARREGVDFILDPMWNPIDDSLFEHIDGLKSTCKKPFGSFQ